MRRMMMVAACALLVALGTSALDAAGEWTLRKNADGIACYTKSQEGLELDQFKGVGVINARLENVASVFRDVPSYTQWMFNCREIRTLQDTGNDRLIVYYVNRSPWPVADRDAVIRSSVSQNEKNGTGIVLIESIQHGHPSPGGRVRMPFLRALFILEYVDREHTRVIFDIKANPGGSIPAALVNTFTRDHPYHTIMGLRRVVAQPKYAELGKTAKERELAEKLFAKKGK